MRQSRIYILSSILLVSALSRADTTPGGALTPDQYRTELDRLQSATQQLDSSGTSTPESLQHLPQSWHVHVGEQDFDILTEGLQRDVRRYEKDKTAENALAIRQRLQSLRRDIDGFEKPPADVSASHTELNSILSQPEFAGRGPKWKLWEAINRKLHEYQIKIRDWLFDVVQGILRILGRLFGWTSIPTVGRAFIYVLMGLALAALLYIAYRTIFRGQTLDEVVPRDLPVSAKEWAVWLAEARAAAAKGQWRDAIHLAYWASISFLERQGFWKPDKARTPREYLRLLSGQSEQRNVLVDLTRIFELAWYAKRDASESTFAQTLEQLEKLGCR